MKCIKSFLKIFILLFIELLLIDTIFMFTKNEILCSLIGCLLMTVIIFFMNKKNLINDLKKIKFTKKSIIISLILTLLAIISHQILLNVIKVDATNQIGLVNNLKKAPFLMCLYLLLLAPISEELIYRYSFNECNNKLSFLLYSIVFAMIHLLNFKTPLELFYIIPYLLTSFSISLQYFKNKNIFTSIIYHIINNFINIVLLLI